MLLTQNYRPRSYQHRQNQTQPNYQSQQSTAPTSTNTFYQAAPIDLDDIDLDEFQGLNSAPPSLSSSPLSQYSVVPQTAFSAASPIPAIAIPRNAGPAINEIALELGEHPTLMHHESWLGGHLPPKNTGRASHHRESSLSSLGSAGPASPYNPNISNPQIAVTDSVSDGFHDLQAGGDGSWQYPMVPKSISQHQEPIYTGYHHYGGLDNSTADMGFPRQRVDRTGLLPAPEFPAGPIRSHPGSVASSTIGGDSPATPSLGEPEDDRRRKSVFPNVPKFDRTMTDVYADELYSPNFAITSAPPSQGHLAVSPTNDLFAQRIQAANSQHLSVGHSPVSAASRGHSPFRQGSPLAPTAGHDFSSGLPSRLQFNSAQRIREQQPTHSGPRMLNQQTLQGTEPNTPQTISPKDSVLDPPEVDADSNFPLFPPQDHDGLYLPPQMPITIQIPQQYPFIAHPGRTHEAMQQQTPAKSSPGDSAARQSATQKPAGSSADGGTYTCTYHGCTLRFDTPALLQKHKREGHRQAHGMNPVRRGNDASSPVSPFNSQAGPHRCDRINPSTGKPCGTIFSRPYDLTRHEDTIHNARKQKVRCELCTEEKTFSRADALTRHFRVCHPDVEFPGKHRRRGA